MDGVERMDATTFSDPVIVNYIKNNFYTVKFDGETKDTIVFNNHNFYNSDPNYKKTNPKMREKTTLVCTFYSRWKAFLSKLCFIR